MLAFHEKDNQRNTLSISHFVQKKNKQPLFLVDIFLCEKGYIDVSDDKNDDISSKLTLTVRVNSAYVNRVKMALAQEEQGIENTLRYSAYQKYQAESIKRVLDIPHH